MSRDGERSQPSEFARPFPGLGQIAEAMNETTQQIPRPERLAGEQHSPRRAPPGLAPHALHRPAVDGQSQLGGRDSETRFGSGDAQVAGRRDLRAGTERRAIHGRDHDGRQIDQSLQNGEQSVGELTQLDTGEIGAAAESRRSPGDHHHSSRLGASARDGLAHPSQRLQIDRVASLGTIDGDEERATRRLGPQGHGETVVARVRNTMNDPSHRDNDPVREQRARIARVTLVANRIGYLLYALAIALFVMAFVLGFSGPLVVIVTVCLVVGSILLAPAIVLGYAIKAAERDDRERGL